MRHYVRQENFSSDNNLIFEILPTVETATALTNLIC